MRGGELGAGGSGAPPVFGGLRGGGLEEGEAGRRSGERWVRAARGPEVSLAASTRGGPGKARGLQVRLCSSCFGFYY